MIPKLRAWLKYDKEMKNVLAFDTRGHSFLGIEGPHVTVDGWCDNFEVGKQAVLMQSTGLKDKNGVEIFEGDIVRSNWYEYDNNAYKKKGEVIFVGAQFVIAYDSQFDLETGEIEYDAHSLSYAENPEVIGNIYENPELLEQANA